MSYLILIISLVGIVFGAKFLVAGSVSVARRYKVSDFVIGAAIVGIGTSMPELVVSFVGALKGPPFYTETKEIFDYPIIVSGTILTCET